MSRFAAVGLAALLATTATVLVPASASAEIKVVASIKPVHSLVAAVMEGVGEPGIIVDGAASPHTYALKPSQAGMLADADVVFWIGPELEAFLEKPLATIAGKATAVELLEAPGLKTLPLREGGTFEAHDHGDHHDGEEGHAGHDHAGHDHDGHDHDGHDHAEHAEGGHDHASGEEHGHGHGEFDAHVWLDPQNAKAMVKAIAAALSKADPAQAATFEANAAAVAARLDALQDDVAATLAPVAGKPFVVFHDGYHYFENRFGLAAAGSITVSPEVMPGAERIAAIRAKLAGLDAACVFAEPQFEPKLIGTVTEGSRARTGVLDPLGADLADGPDLYFSLVRNLGASFSECLGGAN